MTTTLTPSQRSMYEECHQEMMVFLQRVFNDNEQSYAYIMRELQQLYTALTSTHVNAKALECVDGDYLLVARFAITLATNIDRSKHTVMEA